MHFKQFLLGIVVHCLFMGSAISAQDCSSLFRTNSNQNKYEVALGRSGETFDAALTFENEWFRVSERNEPNDYTGKGYETIGTDAFGQKIIFPYSAQSHSLSELTFWANARGWKSYEDWNFLKLMPFRFYYEILKDYKNYEHGLHELLPHNYRKLFYYYLIKIVNKGGRIHFRITNEDILLLKELNKLPSKKRKVEVQKMIDNIRNVKAADLYNDKLSTKAEGTLTRLELLTVVSNKKLFKATFFYLEENRWSAIEESEKQSLWVGD